MLRRVIIAAFIGNFAIRLQRDKSVTKSDWNVHLPAIITREFSTDIFAKCWRATAKINCGVKDSATDTTHQLVLPKGLTLEVQAANGANGL